MLHRVSLMMKRLGAALLRIPLALRRAAFLAYTLALGWLSLASAQTVAAYYPVLQWADKLLHFACYGLLVLLARFAFRDPSGVRVAAWLVPGLAMLYGCALEVAQGWLVQYQRSFEWGDMLANALGAWLFWAVSSALIPARPGTAAP